MNASARFGSGGSRDLDEPVGKESLMDSINERTRRQQQGLPLNLPPADPWDKRTGVKPVTDFIVDCSFIPVNDDWAILTPTITLHDGVYALSKPVEVFRVRSGSADNQVESPVLVALAWTKKMLGSGGVPVLGLHERNPGHMLEGKDGACHMRWHAVVASRLSVAVVRLGGDLTGQARLVLVE